jgi:hypothetical protein
MRQKNRFGPCAAALVGLLLLCTTTVAPVGAEETLTIVGGRLLIDETGGTDCTASPGIYMGPYISGTTYRIVVYCEYKDGNDAIGQTAQFRLEGPDGTVDTKSIWDIPIFNNNWEGTLSVDFTPEGPGTYHWELTCSEGSKSASARGDLDIR